MAKTKRPYPISDEELNHWCEYLCAPSGMRHEVRNLPEKLDELDWLNDIVLGLLVVLKKKKVLGKKEWEVIFW